MALLEAEKIKAKFYPTEIIQTEGKPTVFKARGKQVERGTTPRLVQLKLQIEQQPHKRGADVLENGVDRVLLQPRD
jgi:hypothetical protein